MYQAKDLDEIFNNNKFNFASSHNDVEAWIKDQNNNLKEALMRVHAYGRVRSLYDFHELVKLENIKKIKKLCVVSGSSEELESQFVNYDEIFVTTLKDGFDLTADWLDNPEIKKQIESSDFVLCNQVLEHVPNPEDAFRNICMLAKKGGYIWISIPVINRIHDEPNFYSSGYHPRLLKYFGDILNLEVIHIGAWGSLKNKVFSVSRNWPPFKKLKRGLSSNSNLYFPWTIFNNGLKNNYKHMTDTWALYQKK